MTFPNMVRQKLRKSKVVGQNEMHSLEQGASAGLGVGGGRAQAERQDITCKHGAGREELF